MYVEITWKKWEAEEQSVAGAGRSQLTAGQLDEKRGSVEILHHWNFITSLRSYISALYADNAIACLVLTLRQIAPRLTSDFPTYEQNLLTLEFIKNPRKAIVNVF